MKNRQILMGLMLASLILMPQLAMAGVEINTNLSNLTPISKVVAMINDITSIIFYLAAAIAALLIIVIGIMYMQASDPVEKKKQADRIKTVIIGLIVIVAATQIVNFLFR